MHPYVLLSTKQRGRIKTEDHQNVTGDLGHGGLAQEIENRKNKVRLVRGKNQKDTILFVAELSHEEDRIKGDLHPFAKLLGRIQD